VSGVWFLWPFFMAVFHALVLLDSGAENALIQMR
jgi:hypothetical protein